MPSSRGSSLERQLRWPHCDFLWIPQPAENHGRRLSAVAVDLEAKQDRQDRQERDLEAREGAAAVAEARLVAREKEFERRSRELQVKKTCFVTPLTCILNMTFR